MSAPISGSADGSPPQGFYPDPSIPGYIRYWSGAAWVPGTSRPAPAEGEPMPAPPPSAARPPAPVPPVTPVTPVSASSSMPSASAEPVARRAADETGPVFLDEEPEPEPGPVVERGPAGGGAWQADGGAQDQRVSWGGGAAAAASGPAALPKARDPRLPELPAVEPVAPERAEPPVPAQGQGQGQSQQVQGQQMQGHGGHGQGTLDLRPKPHGAAPGGPPAPLPAVAPAARQAWPAQRAGEATPVAPVAPVPSAGSQGAALPARRPESAPVPVERRQPVGWAQQVHQLAQQGPQAVPGGAVAESAAPDAAWRKPPKDDPFLRAAQAQGRPAALGRRLAARLLDSAVLGAVVGAVAVPLWAKSVEHIDAKVEQARQTGRTVTVWLLDGTTGTYLAIVLGVLLVAGLLYEALPTAKWGRTLGKKVFGVRVLDIESHDTASTGAAVRRWLVYGGLGVVAVGLLNVVWCLFDRPWRQCWHDKVARTFVASAGE
ncbi:RDD family protein [Streptomyces sp. NPDC001678]|uniref:RDD family protein n=1 Tax=Streptomyces sp. NPDC001678 TaxID=3364599 RepID=UPI003687D9DD